MQFFKNLIKKNQQARFYNKFIKYGFDSYIKTFQDFYYQNNQEYQNKLEKLLRNLDDSSIESINRFLELMLKLPLPSQHYLIKKDYIYNDSEFKQIYLENKFIKTIAKYYKIYNLQGIEKLEVNVFKYHCGLKFIPKEKLQSVKNTLFVDGGAFWGDSVLILQKYSPKKIIAFEPNSVNYKLLQQTVKNNNYDNVVLENKGLSNKESKDTLNYISKVQNHGASFVFQFQKNAKKEEIELTRIDEYFKQNAINDKVGILKLDVEGLGVCALFGAEKIITENKPIISCAIYHNPKEFFEVKTLLEQMNPSYKFIIRALSQDFILKELTLVAY